ncbi:MAG: c-type cytochrome biogenesis protein CcsB [Elusimicrobia bacterium RIFCSPLOWO2_12_FULL_59_9]|nr:MAG: c-type cytochrome biogenesis protein CcsB [Elusimicrobia bacterium RIFCSPLOWO2_12_FULL_59_9]
MEVLLIKIGFALLSASVVLSFAYLFSRNENFSLWMWYVLGVGIAAHAAAFVVRVEAFWAIAENRYYFPINSFFGALCYLGWAMMVIFWLVEGKHRLHVLGAFVLPWAWISIGAGLRYADPSVSGLVPALQSYWINIHPVILMTSYAAFANAFGVGLALLIQERQIKSRRPSALCYRLPAIEELDNLNYRIISFAFPVLTVGIFMGGVWAYNAWGRFWGWDAKETWALVTWLIYVVYLHMRLFAGWRGRKTVYVSMAGFAAVVFTFYGVNFLSELHGYLSGGGGIR